MSPIVAAAAPHELSEPTRTWIVDATAYSAFAGPDRQAAALGRQWGLGHALLGTGGHDPPQPLTSKGRVWLTADARLDAREELIASLRAHSQTVGSASGDVELLLAAYSTWGDAFTERIAGDFAFALWDEARGSLVCGRDQIGVVPLHYTLIDGELLVATALDALQLHPAVSDELDEDAIADFLVMGRGNFSATTFRSIRRVPPAHIASWSTGELHFRRYWRQPEWQPLVRYKAREDYARSFRGLLETAVADRIVEGPVAVQVSGGMDSTSVAAFARRVIGQRGLPTSGIRGTTTVLGASTGDQEGHYASLVADSLGIELEILDESSFEPVDPFLEPERLPPEPMPYPWTAMGYASVSRCSAHARVMLTGLPGDALLMFVPWYWAEWLQRGRLIRLAHAYADHARLTHERPHPHLKATARHVVARFGKAAAPTPSWVAADFARRTTASVRGLALSPRATSTDARSVSGEPFWSTLLSWGDPSFTRLPITLRHPLADLRLLEFASRLPPEPWLAGKHILREATRGLLPEPVRARPKTPLVRAPRTSVNSATIEGLLELVSTTAEAERFFDLHAFAAAIRAPDATVALPQNLRLTRALGLVYWRRHWRHPNASGVEREQVRIVVDSAREE